MTAIIRTLAAYGATTLLIAAGLFSTAQAQEPALKATHGAWEVRCSEANICAMVQTFKNDQGVPLLQMTLSKLAEPRDVNGEQAVAIARIIAPLRVLLKPGVSLKIDEGEPRSTEYILCAPDGCMARSLLNDALLGEFQAGSNIEFQTLVETPEGPKVLKASISLVGFTDAYKEL